MAWIVEEGLFSKLEECLVLFLEPVLDRNFLGLERDEVLEALITPPLMLSYLVGRGGLAIGNRIDIS
jgi:hypothetical protein